MTGPEQRPIIESPRLVLRPFKMADAKEVQRLAGDKAIANTTANIPHPYLDGMAEKWIGSHQRLFEDGELVNFAIVLKESNSLIGAIGLKNFAGVHKHAELGYWIGKPFWNNGYATEAAEVVLNYGFSELNLHRIYAHFMKINPASGRVMEKIGMLKEGCLRSHFKKWGRYEDLVLYGILKSEWQNK